MNTNQKGQAVIILLLIMTVSLAIGLSVVGRSINEISTSTKTEDSARAFSAAEAGIEKAISSGLAVGTISPTPGYSSINMVDNQTSAQFSWTPQLPKTNTALEYPSFGRESFAQFWLADPVNSTGGFPNFYYAGNDFDIYFGKADEDYITDPENMPAVEVTIVYRDGSEYKGLKKFYDSNPTRRAENTFDPCSLLPPPISTNNSSSASRNFYCMVNVAWGSFSVNKYPIMARVKLLYSRLTHPVAIKPVSNLSLPPQAVIYESTGTSGDVSRTIRLFKEKSVIPSLFDYALFSADQLQK